MSVKGQNTSINAFLIGMLQKLNEIMIDKIFGIIWACRQHSVALTLFVADVANTDSSALVWLHPEGPQNAW